MKRLVVIILAIVFVAALISYTVTYTVRFTEAAVLTTFGKAGDGAIKLEPGLKFKWPSPIQSVTKYDTRLRYLQARSQTQQTADNRQIIVEAYCTWRVADPLKFFQRFSNAGERAIDHYRKADETLQSSLRSAIGVTSRFTMKDLFTVAKDGSKLPELETAILAAMSAKDQSGVSLAEYGISPVGVGVSRIVLPEETTKAVFERMGENRTRLAKELEAQGEAVAQTIRTTAQADAQRIKAFAERRAQEIRNQGDVEAAEFLAQMQANPELAVFLKNMEFLRDVLSKRTTLVLPTSMPGLELATPDALNGLKPGEIPVMKTPENWPGAVKPAGGAGSKGAEGAK